MKSQLVGGDWEMNFIFLYIGSVIIPTDFHSFQRCRYTTNQTICRRTLLDVSYVFHASPEVRIEQEFAEYWTTIQMIKMPPFRIIAVMLRPSEMPCQCCPYQKSLWCSPVASAPVPRCAPLCQARQQLGYIASWWWRARDSGGSVMDKSPEIRCVQIFVGFMLIDVLWYFRMLIGLIVWNLQFWWISLLFGG